MLRISLQNSGGQPGETRLCPVGESSSGCCGGDESRCGCVPGRHNGPPRGGASAKGPPVMRPRSRSRPPPSSRFCCSITCRRLGVSFPKEALNFSSSCPVGPGVPASPFYSASCLLLPRRCSSNGGVTGTWPLDAWPGCLAVRALDAFLGLYVDLTWETCFNSWNAQPSLFATPVPAESEQDRALFL